GRRAVCMHRLRPCSPLRSLRPAKRTLGRRPDFEYESRWWAAVDSNHLPPRYQHGALPVELAAQATTEIRPPTGSLVGRLILQRPQNKLAGLPRGAGQLPEG